MNINKIVFAVLGVIILILIIMLVIQLNRGTTSTQTVRQSWDFNIWITGKSTSKFEDVINDFKDAYSRYANVRIGLESFSDPQIYTKTITSALWAGIAPDIFLLNNREFSPLQNYISGIDPTSVNPNDFRRDFHPVFSEDLITRANDSDVLIWIPAWFQVPALVYNRRNYPRSSELWDWWRLTVEMQSSAERSGIPPLAIWVGSTITRNSWIILSLLAQEWVWEIDEVQNTHTRQAFNRYRSLWLIGNETYIELVRNDTLSSDIERFARWEVASALVYPKDIARIADIWFQSNMLFVSPFPLSEWKRDAIAIDYDYFVIQKNTWNIQLAKDFMAYIASDRGQRVLAETFPDYISAHSWLALEFAEKAVHPWFNVIQRNFLRDQTELISFWVWSNDVFENGLQDILDRENAFDSWFQILKSRISCILGKYQDFENLSSACR